MLAEFGDDPRRYANAKAAKNYGGTLSITRASGKSHIVLARVPRHHRLSGALSPWAVTALTPSAEARAL